MVTKVEKPGAFFWDIFEKTGSIEAFLLYHKAKLNPSFEAPQKHEKPLNQGSKAHGK
jgi:hypothetical protein